MSSATSTATRCSASVDRLNVENRVRRPVDRRVRGRMLDHRAEAREADGKTAPERRVEGEAGIARFFALRVPFAAHMRKRKSDRPGWGWEPHSWCPNCNQDDQAAPPVEDRMSICAGTSTCADCGVHPRGLHHVGCRRYERVRFCEVAFAACGCQTRNSVPAAAGRPSPVDRGDASARAAHGAPSAINVIASAGPNSGHPPGKKTEERGAASSHFAGARCDVTAPFVVTLHGTTGDGLL